MPDRRADGRVLPHSRLVRYLLPALFAILTTAIGGVTWRFYAGQKELTRRAAQSQLLTVADAKVREISQWRKGRLGEARAIMADTFAAAVFERVIAGKAAASERAAAVDYLRSICTNLHYAGAVLADLDGRPVLWEGHRFGDSSHLKSLMRSVIQAGDVVERDFDVAELPHAPTWGSTSRCAPAQGVRFLAVCCFPSIPRTSFTHFRRGRYPRAARRCYWCAAQASRSSFSPRCAFRPMPRASPAGFYQPGRHGRGYGGAGPSRECGGCGPPGRAGFCGAASGARHRLVSDR